MSTEGRFTVRRFDPGRDREAAYRCYVDGFYQNSWPLIEFAEPRLAMDLIETNAAISGTAFIAEADGEARGLLIGYFPAELRSLLRGFLLMAHFELKVLLRRYRMEPIARMAWWKMTRGFFSFHFRSPKTPAEVLMLNSQKEYRGGIGRALMDAWVAEVRARGYDKTTVGTDSTVDWPFYERYGFTRVREFPINSFAYSMPGEDAWGYIYSLDLTGGGEEGARQER